MKTFYINGADEVINFNLRKFGKLEYKIIKQGKQNSEFWKDIEMRCGCVLRYIKNPNSTILRKHNRPEYNCENHKTL